MSDIFGQKEWDERAVDLKGSILQSWAWGEFQIALGLRIKREFLDRSLNLSVELPLSFNKKYLYSPRGPLGDLNEAVLGLKKELDKNRSIIFARIEPLERTDLPKAAKNQQPTLNWVLDLRPSLDELKHNMKQKHRYNLSLAQKKGVVVREGGGGDLNTLYLLLKETADRGRFKIYPKNYYFKMHETLKPDHIKIFIAEYQGIPCSGMFLSLFGKTASYLHGGSSFVHKDAMSPYLLHWEAIKYSKQAGCEQYDFGGVSKEGDSEHSWAGISRFKRGFGGREEGFPGAYDLVGSKFWYNAYVIGRKAAKILH
jgi:peptidoglycan pentaglycine glycine transferase (the first glycine)